MAAPRIYNVGYSFAGWETANPSLPKPGAAIDAELVAIQNAAGDLRAAWVNMFTDDGGLKPATVGTLQFDQSVYDVMVSAFNAAAGDLLENIPDATTTSRGLMSAADKVALAAAGGGGGSSTSLTIARTLTGPASATLASTDAGKQIIVDTSGGDVTLNIPDGITTPAGSQLMGYLNKRGSGNLTIAIAGTPASAPAIVDSTYFEASRNSDTQTNQISPQTTNWDFTVSGGGDDCALYIMAFAIPNTTGKASGTLGLTVEGTPYTWDKSSTTGAVSAPYGVSTRLKAVAMGTVADGAVIDIDLAISAGWHSIMLFATLVKDVPQAELFDAATAIARTNDVATLDKTPSISLAAGNRRMLYAAACRYGGLGAGTIVTTGATEIENDGNSGSSLSVSSNLRGALAHETGSAGANSATFTWPLATVQMSAEIAIAIPPLTSDALTYIPAAASRILTAADKMYGWLYDDNNNTFQLVG